MRLIRDAQERVARIRHAISVLEDRPTSERGEDKALRRLRVADGQTLPVLHADDTMAVAAEAVLAASGQPLHIKEISQRMVAAGFRNRDARRLRVNMNKTLDRSAASPTGVFTRPDKATYGLRRWERELDIFPVDMEEA